MHRSCQIVRVFVWAISITCLLLLVVGAALSAPVPVSYRIAATQHPAQLVGEWTIHWQGGAGHATFHRQGGYTCVWCGQRWIGYWSVEDDVLTVTEAVEPSSPATLPNWYTWKASLNPGKRGGHLPSGGSFTLTPRSTRKTTF